MRRSQPLRMLFLSVGLVVPCYWQSRIQAGDLSSHVYNAWLSEQVLSGKVEGLTVVSQWTNVLFDLILRSLMDVFGTDAAQPILMSALVLLFFWGAFTFTTAAVGRRTWSLTPCLAMLSYGWVFHMGFCNFYLSMGLSLFAAALFWQGGRGKSVAAAFLLLLGTVAHPLPSVWAAGMWAYTWLAGRLPERERIWMLPVGIAFIVSVRVILVAFFPTIWSTQQILLFTGADQMVVYTTKYVGVFIGLLVLWILLLYRFVDVQGIRGVIRNMSFQAYVLTAVIVVLIPATVHFPQYAHSLTAVSQRMSLAAGVLLCTILAAARPTRWHVAGFSLIGLIFFSFLYVDTLALNRVENKVQALVQQAPQGQRVVSALCDTSNRFDPLLHIVDRACVGRCFSYGNYEPSTAQFRVRAANGASVVVSDYADIEAIQAGRYVVKERDAGLLQVRLCGDNSGELCLRRLQPGEITGRTCFRSTPLLW